MTRFPFDGVALGCDYNPEQWPRAVWPEDIRLMQVAGVGFVSETCELRSLIRRTKPSCPWPIRTTRWSWSI